MPHADSSIEYVAFTCPCTFILRDGFEVRQDATVELIHLIKSKTLEIRGCLLASDSARAKHRDLRLVCQFVSRSNPLRKLSERPGPWIDGTVELADSHLVVVPGIDQHDIRVGDEVVPFRRRHSVSGVVLRIDRANSEGNYLALEPDSEAVERRCVCRCEFHWQIGGSSIRPNVVDHCLDTVCGSCDRSIDPLARQQDGAKHLIQFA